MAQSDLDRTTRSKLENMGNIPISTAVLASLVGSMANTQDKIRRMEQAGDVLRLKRGLYVVSPAVSRTPLSVELIANQLYSPSYISCLSALRYYGLIPETVYQTQSMTTKHTRTFETPQGVFSYYHIDRNVFPIGLTNIVSKDYSFVIATPEKALCDLVSISPQVNLRYLTDAQRYLEEDIRLDMEAFLKMNLAIFEEYAGVGKKKTSIQTLLKLLRQ